MAVQIQLRRGTTAEHSSFTGVIGEITMDTTKNVVVVHNGSLLGGFPLALASGSAITAASLLVNNNLNISTGNAYQINGTSVLNATTLGSGVTASSLTSVGTLSSLTVNGDATVQAATGTRRTVYVGTTSTSIPGIASSDISMIRISSNQQSILEFEDRSQAANSKKMFMRLFDNKLGIYRAVNDAANASTLALEVENATGNLAVDTNTLYVDAANNRVGIGLTNPGETLDVKGTGNFNNVGGTYLGFQHNATQVGYVGTANAIITGGATTNFGLYAQSAMVFSSGGATERMRLDASGNLGLGVTPSYKLHVVNDTAATNSAVDVLALTQSTTGTAASGLGAGILFNSERPSGGIILKRGAIYGVAGTNADDNGDLAFYTLTDTGASGFSEKMRLDASGNLGVGRTSPATRLDVAQTNAKSATGIWHIQTFDTTSATTGVGGGISFGGYKTSTSAAEVFAAIDGYKENATGGNAAGALRFHTQVSGGSGVVERARITSGGYFKASNAGTYNNATGTYHELYSTTDNNGSLVVKHAGTSGTQYGISILTVNDQNDATRYFLSGDGGGTERVTLRSNGGLANYSANNVNLASDERLKKDIAPLASTWDKLKAIEVVNFRYKDCNEGDPALYGVIAQQVQPIVPELVVVTREAVEAKDAELDEDGNEVKPAVEAAPEYYGIREQPMYWLAIKALQEAQARIEALEARLEALEA